MAVSQIDPNGLNVGQLGSRNMVINGDMRIDQRNSGSSVTGHSADLFGVDRFRAFENHSGSISCQRVADAPEGFEYSNKITTTGTDTSLAATEFTRLVAPIEGNNISHLNLGSSNAKTCALSFWVKSSLTGTFCISIFNAAANRSMVKEYTISSANTWEYKTIEVIGDTTGTWLTTNSAGIYISWSLGTGTTYQTSTLNSYQAAFKMASSSQVNLVGTANSTWQITGVQLEVSPTGEATPFEHRSSGEEMALCERYFQKVAIYGESIIGQAYNTTSARFPIHLPVEMRASPALTVPPPGQSGNAFKPLTLSLSWPGGTGANAGNALSNRHFYITCTNYSGLAAGNASTIYANSNNVFITASAEL